MGTEITPDRLCELARDAVDAWDGEDAGRLLHLLAVEFGVPLWRLLELGRAEQDRQAADYARPAD